MISLVFTFWFRQTTHLLVWESIPKVKTLNVLAMGAQSTLTALRNWIVIGDPEFKTERARVWKEDIWPHLERLQGGRSDRGRSNHVMELGTLNSLFGDLFELQWKIEDVVHTPGNEPARVLMEREVIPIAASIEGTVSKLKESVLTSDHAMALERFGYAFRRSFQFLSGFMETGAPSQEKKFNLGLELARRTIGTLVNERNRLTQDKARLVLNLDGELNHLATFAKEAISIRKTDQWNIAKSWVSDQLIPLEREIKSQLQDTRFGLEEEVAVKTDEAAFMGNMIVLLSLGLMSVMILMAFVMSKKGE